MGDGVVDDTVRRRAPGIDGASLYCWHYEVDLPTLSLSHSVRSINGVKTPAKYDEAIDQLKPSRLRAYP